MAARIPSQEREAVAAARGLPEALAVGAGTALRLDGSLSAGLLPLRRLTLRLGEIERAVDGFGLAAAAGGGEELLWWAVLPLSAGARPGPAPVSLLAEGPRGAIEVMLGTIRLESGLGAAPLDRLDPPEGPGPLVAVCMATHEPDEAWLRRQIDSIRAQSWGRWVCLISDDASSPAACAAIERAVAEDPRFVLSRSERRLGFYANFERALRMAPPEAELIALCDHDDRWHPDKLEALAGALAADPGSALAYSDMRIVDETGTVLSDTYWYLLQNGYEDIASLLITNTVTGAASLFRRELLETALPFPPGGTGEHYHDHWLALCALALGRITYLDRPTYDYTRHPSSVTVTALAEWHAPPEGLHGRLRVSRRRAERRLRLLTGGAIWREVYLERLLLIRQFVAVLELRAGDRVAPAKRRRLRRLSDAERSPRAVGWLAARNLRPLAGRNETGSREPLLLGALIWRAVVTRRARRRG